MLAALLTTVALWGGGQSCQEDMSCWNWVTMGNHRRGVVLLDGRKRSVNRRQFCWYYKNARIDWSKTKHMKSDPYCREIAIIG